MGKSSSASIVAYGWHPTPMILIQFAGTRSLAGDDQLVELTAGR